MGLLTRKLPLLGTLIVASALLAGLTPSGGEARPGSTTAAKMSSLARAESNALLQLYAAEASLARAQDDLARLEARAATVSSARSGALQRAEIVRRSLRASQRRVAELLRTLYIDGEPDPIAVLLGATSLDEAMAGIEGLSRATATNERLGREATQRAQQLRVVTDRLAREEESLRTVRAQTLAGARRIEAAVSTRRITVASIRRQRAVTVARLAILETTAQQAGRRAAEQTPASGTVAGTAASDAASTIPTPSEPPTPATATVQAGGTRSFAADIVAYHLPGRTASGLPVGSGVVAVDPTVIPLGTRLFIPGYGPAVAADVGSAVKGNIIDLWMPSTTAARAWGRRAVTITIYG